MNDTDGTKRIAALNDRLRTTFFGGKIMMTAAVDEMARQGVPILQAVRAFNDFNPDNDEHDFGSFNINGETFFWKIDYFAPDMEHGSEDPADVTKTTRVLMVMLASEY